MAKSEVKRKITMSLLILAGTTVVVALCLAGPWDNDVTGSGTDHVDTSHVTVTTPPPPITVTTPPPPPTIVKLTPPPPPPKPKPTPKVDVVFVLDTTGSMSGLISGAKRKIWSIANQIISGQPRPHVRVGLIGYRDLGDDYVTRRYGLTEEIDDVQANLRRFRAGGGGDTPEHVNRALAEALRRMHWRSGQHVLRQIFLVGDAPPHEGRDGLYSRALAQEAARRGIVINTVRCGSMATTAATWRRIALAAGGQFASIRQDGGMVAVRTPLDERLRTLNAALTDTLLPTGSSAGKAHARRRAMDNRRMDAWAQAESAKYRAKSGRLDSKDLLTQMARGKKLSDMSEAELPAPVAALPQPARKAYVANVVKRRRSLKRKILSLSKQRDAYIKAKRPKTRGFDDTIGSALKAQGAKAGIAY